MAFVLVSVQYAMADAVPDPTEYNVAVDFSKIRFWVGEGENKAAFVYQATHYGGLKDVPSNLVYGYRWDGEAPTVKKMIEDIVAAEPRFLDLVFEGNEMTSLTFENYKGLTSMPFRKGSWTSEVYVSDRQNSNDYKKSDYTHDVVDNETVVWRQVSDDHSAILVTYMMYRPADDEIGVFVPDRVTYHHDNNGSAWVPSFVNFGGNLSDYEIDSRELIPLTEDSPLNSYATSDGLQFNESTCYTDFPLGIADYKVSINYHKSGEEDAQPLSVQSGSCTVEVKKPARPLVAINFEQTRYAFKWRNIFTINMTEGYDMRVVMQPADATYTYCSRTCSGALSKFNKDAMALSPANILSCKKLDKDAEYSVTYASVLDPEVTATTTFVFSDVLENPVTDIAIDEIHIPYRHIWGEIGKYVRPENANFKTLSVVEIENPKIVGFYGSTQDLISYQAGETYVTFKSLDGADFTKRIKVVVEDPVKYDGDFQNGMFVMNEGWYNHANTSINFFPDQGEIYYNAFAQMNPGLTLSGTGTGGFYWDDKIFLSNGGRAASEQLPGVDNPVLDINDLKNLGYTNLAGPEGIGVAPNLIVCKSIVKGSIAVVDYITGEYKTIESEGENVEFIDLVKAGKYVFAIASDRACVFDIANERHIATITGFSNGKKARQSADGNIWILCADEKNGAMAGIDPIKLELIRVVDMPYAAGFNTNYLWYHPSRFFASTTENAVFWLDGTRIYRWDISDSSSTSRILCSNVSSYGGPSYDPVNNRILLLFGGIGYPGRYVSNIYYDPQTGEKTKTVELAENYWFPSMAIYPSRFLPEINLENIEVGLKEPVTIDLAEYLNDSDPGDLNFNICPSLTDAGDASVAEVILDDLHRTLTVTPVAEGTTTIGLSAMSRGNVVEREIPVKVSAASSGIMLGVSDCSVSIDGRHLSIIGMSGHYFTLVNTQGTVVEQYEVHSDAFAATIKAAPGIYILYGDNSAAIKVWIR